MEKPEAEMAKKVRGPAKEVPFVVHLLVRDEGGPIRSEPVPRLSRGGRFRCACDPDLVVDGRRHMGTASANSADCPGCRGSALWEEAYARQGSPEATA